MKKLKNTASAQLCQCLLYKSGIRWLKIALSRVLTLLRHHWKRTPFYAFLQDNVMLLVCLSTVKVCRLFLALNKHCVIGSISVAHSNANDIQSDDSLGSGCIMYFSSKCIIMSQAREKNLDKVYKHSRAYNNIKIPSSKVFICCSVLFSKVLCIPLWLQRFLRSLKQVLGKSLHKASSFWGKTKVS